jgi:hypothetical protein
MRTSSRSRFATSGVSPENPALSTCIPTARPALPDRPAAPAGTPFRCPAPRHPAPVKTTGPESLDSVHPQPGNVRITVVCNGLECSSKAVF